MAATLKSMRDRWSDSTARPLFKGKLIDSDGCCCAQGDVLRVCGWTDDQLRQSTQLNADQAVAELLGISQAHSALLRVVNDRHDGCPQDVLDVDGPGIVRVLGPDAKLVLAFWRYLDSMISDQWSAWEASSAGASVLARSRARDAASSAARDAAGSRAVVGAGSAVASLATSEVQGISKLITEPYFLPMFGVTIEQLRILP